MEVYLIRHTTPGVGKDVCYGQADVPLSGSFEDELEWLKTQLPKSFDTLFTSPSYRCRILGEQIKANGYFTDERLLELNFGEWEMKRWDEIALQERSEWVANYVTYQIPGGESFADLYGRVSSFYDDLHAHGSRRVAIVTHAGVIRCFISRLLEFPLKNAFKISVDYASITKLRIGEEVGLSGVVLLNKSAILPDNQFSA